MNAIGCVRNCGKVAKGRGLCHAHYAEARRHVMGQRTTWGKLVRLGLAKPPRPDHRYQWNGGTP